MDPDFNQNQPQQPNNQPNLQQPQQPAQPQVPPQQQPTEYQPHNPNPRSVFSFKLVGIFLAIIVGITLLVLGGWFGYRNLVSSPTAGTEPGANSSIGDLNKEDFLLPIEIAFNEQGAGIYLVGEVEGGYIEVGDEIELVGRSDTERYRIKKIEIFDQFLDRAVKGDNAAINIELDDPYEFFNQHNGAEGLRGRVLAYPSSVEAYSEFEATYAVEGMDDGFSVFLKEGKTYDFWFRTGKVEGKIVAIDGPQRLKSGDTTVIKVVLAEPYAMQAAPSFKEGATRFNIFDYIDRNENDDPCCNGYVTQTLQSVSDDE